MGLRNYVVQFDIPYHIQVEDSFKENKDRRFYPVIDDIPAEIRFQSNAETEMDVGTAGTVAGDRHGNFGYSSVKVWFGNKFIQTIPEDIDDEMPIDAEPVFHMGQPRGTDRYLIKNAVEYLNKFLRIYRASTNFYWINSLSTYEIGRFSIADRYEDDTGDNRVRFVTQSALKSGPMDEAVLDRVRKGVQSPSPLTIYNELDLNAEDKIDRGEFNSAIIDSAILFEAWVEQAYQIVAVEQGKSEEEALEDITKGDDSDETISPKNIIKDHLSKFGFDFSETDEFEAWDKDTRIVRHKVVHDGYQASQQEARDAKDGATAALVRLSDEFEQELRGTPVFVQEQSKIHLERPGE